MQPERTQRASDPVQSMTPKPVRRDPGSSPSTRTRPALPNDRAPVATVARRAAVAASATWGTAATGRKARQERVEYRGIVEWGIQKARV